MATYPGSASPAFSAEEPPGGLSISPSTGLIGGSLGASAAGKHAVTVTVDDGFGVSSAVSFDWFVSPSRLSAQVLGLGLVAGRPLGWAAVGPFTTADRSRAAADFTAVIDWGDGTSGAGALSASGGVLTVSGTHKYAAESSAVEGGAYTVTATVSTQAGGSIVAANTVVVVRPPLAVFAADTSSPVVDSEGRVLLGAFTDPNAAHLASLYSGATVKLKGGEEINAAVQGDNGLFLVYTAAPPVAPPPDIRDLVQGVFQLPDRALRVGYNIANAAAVVAAKALSVQFGTAGGGFTPRKDDGGKYDPVAWQLRGGSAQSAPFAQPAGKRITISAAFNRLNLPGLHESIDVVGEVIWDPGDGKGVPWKTRATGTATMDPEDPKRFLFSADTEDALPEAAGAGTITIKWTAKAGGLSADVGVSSSTLYVTRFKVDARFEPVMFETVVALGSKGAAGKSKRGDVLKGIWTNFSEKRVKNWAGSPLTYYKTWPTFTKDDVPKVDEIAKPLLGGLLKTLDGQCGAFAGLFEAAALAQGLAVIRGGKFWVNLGDGKDSKQLTMRRVVHFDRRFGFLVGPWSFVGKAKRGLYVETLQDEMGNAWSLMAKEEPGKDALLIRYPPAVKTGAAYAYRPWGLGGAPSIVYGPKVGTLVGQNNHSPAGAFSNHMVVTLGKTIYDPSYGDIYANESDMQKKAVKGYFRVGAEGASWALIAQKPNNAKLGIKLDPIRGWEFLLLR